MFGSKCDYNQLLNECVEMKFIDISENEDNSIDEYILGGIKDFKREKSKSMVDILSNREVFKDLIFYLNNIYKIKYVQIRDFFQISRGVMDALKRK